MLNTDKIKLMTKLSIYEDREGYNKKIVSRYFREDYVGYNMMISFVSVTAGYILLLILWALYFGEELLLGIQDLDFISLGIRIFIVYGILLAMFMAVSYLVYNARYARFKKKLKSYQSGLKRLNRMYELQDKTTEGKKEEERP